MPKFDEKKIVLLLIFLHLAVAVPLALKLNIWVDEASTLYTTKNGFFEAFQNVFADEKQAPLYFLMLSLWRKINDSIFFARLFSIVCSLAAIFAFSNLAKKFWQEKTALFLTAIFALHPYLFWASVEIRLYSFIILITCLLFSFFYDGYLREESTDKRAQIFYVLTAIVALYTNYYLGFLLVGAFAALLVLRKFKEAKSYFSQMLIVSVAILPLLYFMTQQFTDRSTTFNEPKSILEGIKIIWNHFLFFVFPTEIYPPEEPTIFSKFRLWFMRFAVGAVLILLAKNRFKDIDKKIVAFLVIFAVCGLFFQFVYFQLGAGLVEIRHAAIYFVAVFLFVFSILVKILPKKSWIFAAAFYSIFFVYAIYAMYPNFTKRGDWARVAEFIEQNEKPNQPIVSFPVYETIALPNYYKGVNRIFPDEKFFSFFPEQMPDSPQAYSNQIKFVISEIPFEAEEIWLLTAENCDVGRACEPLENFVNTNYTLIEERNFYKEKVRLLRKKND